jgi:hypothetical protein
MMDRVLEVMQWAEPSNQVILSLIYQCQKPVDLKDACFYKFSVFLSLIVSFIALTNF